MTVTDTIEAPQVELVSLAQHPKGFWVATFTADGERIEASNAFGSWQIPLGGNAHDDDSKTRRQLLDPYAQQAQKALSQQLVRAAE